MTTPVQSLNPSIESIPEDFRNLIQEWLSVCTMLHLAFIPTYLPEVFMSFNGFSNPEFYFSIECLFRLLNII